MGGMNGGSARAEKAYSSEWIATDFPSVVPEAQALWAELQRLDLLSHVAELETLGYTVVSPEKVAPEAFTARLREAILDVAERRNGRRPDLSADSPDGNDPAFGSVLFYLLFEDEIFQQAATNPVVTALTTYMLGKNAVISSCNALIKGQGKDALATHTDINRMPSPFPAHPQVLNVTYALTDFNYENGCTSIIPGSHRYYRGPLPNESEEYKIPLEARAGSLLLWSGHTWHGAYPRTQSGLRVSLVMPFFRPYLARQELYRENIDKEIIANLSPRLASIIGMNLDYGYAGEGPPENVPPPHSMGRHVYD